jgi:tripartite-type tricarboxylate transporter receptor subunit TctC
MVARRSFPALAAAVLLAGAANGAWAAWPEKPVNYIIAFNPGGESLGMVN